MLGRCLHNVFAFTTACLVLQVTAPPVLDPSIATKLQANKVANILISFTQSHTPQLMQDFDGRSHKSRENKLTAFHSLLKTHADKVQQNTMKLLKAEEAKRQSSEKPVIVRPLWITNQIIVMNADQPLIDQLSTSPEISGIDGEQVVGEPDPKEVPNDNSVTIRQGNSSEPQWGVKYVKAPEIWKTEMTKGEGVVVGVFDTGVRGTHEALKNNHRTPYGWFDAIRGNLTPVDANGHGSHVAGIVVGQTNGIGIAPGAKWIACRALNENLKYTDIRCLGCVNWFTCPTDMNGQNADCTKAPNIINASLRIDRSQSADFLKQFNAIVSKWIENGIVPIFAAGNSGQVCGIVSTTGGLDVVTVGAADKQGSVILFSSSGPPTINVPSPPPPNLFKPDVCGPGLAILSAFPSGTESHDLAYRSIDGTSMATPHVTGVAALFFSKFPEATFDDFKSSLRRSAVFVPHKPHLPDNECGDVSFTVRPNNIVGYGNVDAVGLFRDYRAMKARDLDESKSHGTSRLEQKQYFVSGLICILVINFLF